MVSSVIAAQQRERPRWYTHGYNRADFYRLAAALSWLPRRGRLRLARTVGRFAIKLMPVEHGVVRTTLARVLETTDARRVDALAVRTFMDFAMCFSDLMSTNRQPVAQLMGCVGRVQGVDSVPTGAGLISLTAHVGNWEMAGRLLAGRSARPTHVVVAEEEALQLERWLRRDGDGVRFVTRTRPTVSLELVAALRRGEVVAVQGDRALGTRGDVLVPFFGHLAPFPLGPFVLARAVGMPMLPAFCLLEADYRYTVRVVEPLAVARGGEEEAARAWVAVLENVVREYPTQWFNFFDVWNPWSGEPARPGGRIPTGTGARR
ncbi:MAG TPA: lysophospholipid acyltransferase family protein [Candidatus Methylomirabilis sp.]|nr:lysophospholipid acyltransferase family protein [Candidatus Methylomirabilis sp.]